MATLPTKIFLPIDKTKILSGNKTDLYDILVGISSKVTRYTDQMHHVLTNTVNADWLVSGANNLVFTTDDANTLANAANGGGNGADWNSNLANIPSDLFYKLTDSLDDIQNGANYVKVALAALNANGMVLLSNVVGNLDNVSNGANYGKILLSDTSNGHVVLANCVGNLDSVNDGGTYGRVLLTDISAGHVILANCVGNLDNVANGANYGRVLLTDISAGHILLANCVGNLDNVVNGVTYGRVALTDISSGHILLANCVGNLDNISDGTNYGRIGITSISGGKIVVAGLANDALDRLFSSSNMQDNIEGWVHANDVTMIDGGDIYTSSITANKIAANTITANKLAGNAFGTLTITSGSIVLSTANAITVNATNGIRVSPGGDIFLTANANNPAELRWYYDANHYLTQSMNSSGTFLSYAYYGGTLSRFTVGSNYTELYKSFMYGANSAGNAFLELGINGVYPSHNVYANLKTYYNSGNYTQIDMWVGNGTTQINFDAYEGGTRRTVYLQGSTSTGLFNPYPANALACGNNTYYWSSVASKIWNTISDFYFLDDRDDLALLKGIKGSGVIDELTGFELINDDTVDESLYSKHPENIFDEDGKLVCLKGDSQYTPDGKPLTDLKTWISLLRGGLCQLSNQVDTLANDIKEVANGIKSSGNTTDSNTVLSSNSKE